MEKFCGGAARSWRKRKPQLRMQHWDSKPTAFPILQIRRPKRFDAVIGPPARGRDIHSNPDCSMLRPKSSECSQRMGVLVAPINAPMRDVSDHRPAQNLPDASKEYFSPRMPGSFNVVVAQMRTDVKRHHPRGPAAVVEIQRHAGVIIRDLKVFFRRDQIKTRKDTAAHAPLKKSAGRIQRRRKKTEIAPGADFTLQFMPTRARWRAGKVGVRADHAKSGSERHMAHVQKAIIVAMGHAALAHA